MTYTYVTPPAAAAEALRATYAAHEWTLAEAFAQYAGSVAEAVAVLLDTLDALVALRGTAGEMTATDVRGDVDTLGETLSAVLNDAEALAAALAEIEPDAE